MTNQIAQMCPLVEKVSVYIDTIWFAEIFGDQSAYGWKVFALKRVFILYVSQALWESAGSGLIHRHRGRPADDLLVISSCVELDAAYVYWRCRECGRFGG